MSSLSSKVTIDIEWLGGEDFKIKFGSKSIDELIISRSRVPREEIGGEARELLAASIAECMSSTLLFYLKWAKIKLNGLRSTVEVITDKDEQGHYRVSMVNLNFNVEIPRDKETLKKLERVKKILSRGCFISRSLERGVKVNFSIST